LPVQWWWLIRDLYLDDGAWGTIDLAVIGPGGVFAVEFSATGADDCVARVSHHALRLRGYLPHCDVVPVIVTPAVAAARFGPNDASGYPIAWVSPPDLLGFLHGVRRRGLVPQQISMLNWPAPGWYRRLEICPDGAVDTLYGWTS
jgi:hypothetical protein